MSKVYFTDLKSNSKSNNKQAKLQKLLIKSGYLSKINPEQLIAIKLHFGEEGKDTFIRPILVRPIVDKLKDLKTLPFLTDTNTLYTGPRKKGPSHLEIAHKHGFTPIVTNAPVVIADGINGKNYTDIKVDLKHFNKCHIAGEIVNSDSMVVLSHYKGHEMAGFGGAIKNLAMGCAPPIGKGDQHSTNQTVNEEDCIGCKQCIESCAFSAIKMINEKANINREKCVGCGECMTVCPTDAIYLDWKTELTEFNERMVEYAYASVKNKENLYINFLVDITPNCDCVPWSDKPLVKDIGILASTDPVAIDQASFDLVSGESEEGKNVFKSVHPNTVGEIQLNYGQKIGLGEKIYDLIKI
ncbi:MAG: DUF362 domain-containing protein [Bacillota bacterium]